MAQAAQHKTVAIIGAGPGGYVAAIKLGQQGFSVKLLDASDSLGGTCLNWGCIPTKALLEWSHKVEQLRNGDLPGIKAESFTFDWQVALNWKNQLIKQLKQGIRTLLKKQKVEVINAKARFIDNTTLELASPERGDVQDTLSVDYIVIATGGETVSLPNLSIDGKQVITVEQALALETLPESLAIVGGGVIGLEMATLFSQLGVRVEVIEAQPALLPGWQAEAVKVVVESLRKKGVTFHLGKALNSAALSESQQRLTLNDGSILSVAQVLVAVGRRPNTRSLNLEAAGLAVDERGFIPVDSQCRTSVSNFFAIGDCVQGPQLAHRASYEAGIVTQVLNGQTSAQCDWAAMPQVIYTTPNLAQVGWPWPEVETNKAALQLGQFPWLALGKAHVVQQTKGHVLLAGLKATGQLVHASMAGPEADNQIGALGLAIELGASLDDVASTIQPHPSLMEAWPEAAEMASHGLATHW